MKHFWLPKELSCDILADLFAGSFWDTPAVAPKPATVKLPKPSQWAKEQFNFQPNIIQTAVLDADTQRLILCCNRQWGKSAVLAIKALHYAMQNPKASIVVVSRSEKQGGELINKVRDFANLCGLPDRRVRGYDFSLELDNGAKILAIAHSTETGPCRTADILIYEEAAMVKDKVFSVTLPFIAHTNGAVWMMSTPRGQIGFFYNFWHDEDPQWTRIFSTVDDCPEISKEFLELSRKGAPDEFRREFYCEFAPPGQSLFDRRRMKKNYNPELSARKLPPL